MRREVALHHRIVGSLLVPLLDRVGNDRDLAQGVTVENLRNLRARWSVRQQSVGDRADHLVTFWAISQRWRNRAECEQEKEQGFSHGQRPNEPKKRSESRTPHCFAFAFLSSRAI